MRPAFFLFAFSFLMACADDTSKPNAVVYSTTNSPEEIIQKGKVLFSANCQVCHSLDVTTPTGLAPSLDSIAYHWPDKEELAQYIHNAPEEMQQTERSRQLYREWKDKAQMPPFSGLNGDEIKSIVDFIYTY